MICPKCGANTPDGIQNCIKCGTVFNQNSYNQSINDRQAYYNQNAHRNVNSQGNVKNFGNSVNQSFNDLGNSINRGFQAAGKEFNSATDAIQNRVNAYKNSSELNKKGDDAFIMSIVAIALSFLGFNIVSLVLGIVALNWAKKAFPITKVHNHELAKTLSIVAIVVSAIEVGAIFISLIASLIIWIITTSRAFGNYGGFFGEFIMIHSIF